MGLFNEIKCVHCGKKAGMLSRKKLCTGDYVCSKCTSVLPHNIEKRLELFDYEYFKQVLNCMKDSEEFGKIFKETHRFYSIHLDAEKGLFYLDGDRPRVYYLLSMVEDFNMQFLETEASDTTKGIFNKKIVYDNPKGMDEFLYHFKRTWSLKLEESAYRNLQEQYILE